MADKKDKKPKEKEQATTKTGNPDADRPKTPPTRP